MDDIPQIQDPPAYYAESGVTGFAARWLCGVFAVCAEQVAPGNPPENPLAEEKNAAPNADMSDRDQREQYAYGKTIAAVMTDPERDFAEISSAAARANMDVVFGENHDAMDITMRQIKALIDSSPDGHIKAIALEFPVEMQELFDPVALQDMTREEFMIGMVRAQIDSYFHELDIAEDTGLITYKQHDFLFDHYKKKEEGNAEECFRSEVCVAETLNEPFVSVYDVAVAAAARNIPVIAADVGRQRLVAHRLDRQLHPDIPENIAMSFREIDEVFDAEMDDRDDVELLKDFGIDIEGEGIVIVHRGYAHINDMSRVNPDVSLTNGFDDVLERAGR